MSSSLAGDTLPSSTQSYYYAPNATDSAENSVDTRGSSAARTTAPEGLLLHAGNDRQNAQIVRELESRSKSYLFSSDHPSVSNASTDASRSQVLNAFFLVFHLRWCFWRTVIDCYVKYFERKIFYLIMKQNQHPILRGITSTYCLAIFCLMLLLVMWIVV